MNAILAWLQTGSPPHWMTILGFIVYAHIEWVLPRIEKVKANSALEALGNFGKMILANRIPLIGKVLTAMATKDENVASGEIETKPEETKPIS